MIIHGLIIMGLLKKSIIADNKKTNLNVYLSAMLKRPLLNEAVDLSLISYRSRLVLSYIPHYRARYARTNTTIPIPRLRETTAEC